MVKGAAIEVTNTENASEMSNDLIDWAYEHGIKKFFEQIEAKQLYKAMEEAGVKSITETDTKDTLCEKFLDAVEQDTNGPEGFLSKMSVKTLKAFVSILDFETDAEDQKQYSEDIADELLLNGTRLLLKPLDKNQLSKTATKLGLKHRETASRNAIEDLVLNQVFDGIVCEEPEKKEKKEKKEKTEKKKPNTRKSKTEKETSEKSEGKISREERDREIRENRPPLEKGITKDEIFQNYWANEIKDFCKENGIKTQGSKMDLIRRIVEFLDDPEKKGFTAKKRKRKAGSKKNAKKEKKTTDETKEEKDE